MVAEEEICERKKGATGFWLLTSASKFIQNFSSTASPLTHFFSGYDFTELYLTMSASAAPQLILCLKKAIKFYLHFAVILKMSQSQCRICHSRFIFYRNWARAREWESNAMVWHTCAKYFPIIAMNHCAHQATRQKRTFHVQLQAQMWCRYWNIVISRHNLCIAYCSLSLSI